MVVRNGTDTPGLAQRAVAQLKAAGYTDVRTAAMPPPRSKCIWRRVQTARQNRKLARTVLLDTGVANPDAPQDIALLLGVSSPVTARQPLKPNKVGWTPPAAVEVTLGKDYVVALKAAGALDTDVIPPHEAGNGASPSAN